MRIVADHAALLSMRHAGGQTEDERKSPGTGEAAGAAAAYTVREGSWDIALTGMVQEEARAVVAFWAGEEVELVG